MKIKEARQAAGLTQAQAAKILKVSKRTIEEWEAGNRRPKGSEDALAEKISIAGMLTEEGRKALIDGELTFEELADEYKIQTARRLSRWGKFPETFSAIWARIPESAVTKLTGEELAELVEALQTAYNDGVAHGGNDHAAT